jgi:hypothetical protein
MPYEPAMASDVEKLRKLRYTQRSARTTCLCLVNGDNMGLQDPRPPRRWGQKVVHIRHGAL